jgi:hypothetical protein
VRAAAGAAFNKAGVGEILVRLGDCHVIDAELRSEPSDWREPHAGCQFAGSDAVDDLLMHLHEKWSAITFRELDRERARLNRAASRML